ncbi:uncharacterized protein LOC131608910 isoform X9 [Vicia villosa]|uniref:uncharacterized protein LOC131608910 isoform X9 n=1 Tax=Vicia villosa TaxID=3911 RepID=UPI00273B2EAE|nr:uncharacterized protein LOC131608910 isoform X9 [Vicia villosa]
MFLDKSTSAISDTYKLNCFHTTTMSFVRLDTLSDQFITQSIMLIYLCVSRPFASKPTRKRLCKSGPATAQKRPLDDVLGNY